MTTPHQIIACGSLYHEFESLIRKDNPVTIHYLDTDLHRTPSRIPQALQTKIDEIDAEHENNRHIRPPDTTKHETPKTVNSEDFHIKGRQEHAPQKIILGYGLCSNGIVGVKSRQHTLVIPRVHDCLDLFLGFVGKGVSRGNGSTRDYYLTPGTLLNQKDPYSIMTLEYTPKMGEKMAQWGMKEELKHYTRFILITTPRSDMDEIRHKALQNTEFFGMELIEKYSNMTFLSQILYGPHNSKNFLRLPPGDVIAQEMFI